jgi:hypothetical protein
MRIWIRIRTLALLSQAQSSSLLKPRSPPQPSVADPNPGSGIEKIRSGKEKVRIRDKVPGSATLASTEYFSFEVHQQFCE